jgi:hypothetical protein
MAVPWLGTCEGSRWTCTLPVYTASGCSHGKCFCLLRAGRLCAAPAGPEDGAGLCGVLLPPHQVSLTKRDVLPRGGMLLRQPASGAAGNGASGEGRLLSTECGSWLGPWVRLRWFMSALLTGFNLPRKRRGSGEAWLVIYFIYFWAHGLYLFLVYKITSF